MEIQRCRDEAIMILKMAADSFPAETRFDFYEMAGLSNPQGIQTLPDEARWYFDLTRFLHDEGYLRTVNLRDGSGLGSGRITSKGLSLLGQSLFDEPER